MGDLTLAITRLRQASFFPNWLELRLTAADQVLAMGDQTLMQMAGEQRDALRPRVVPEKVAGHAGLAAAAGTEHRLIQQGACPRSRWCGKAAHGRAGPAP